MKRCRWQPAIPPSGYKSMSVTEQIDPNPMHFANIRREACEACNRSEPCCEKGCDVYQKAVAVADELRIDPCTSCDNYMIFCLGIQDVDPDAAVQVHNVDFPDPKELLADCPF